MFKKKNDKIEARIIKIDDKDIVVLLEKRGNKYKIGQNVVATVPVSRKTGLGNWANIAEVVAQGKITKVEGEKVTIDSKYNSPVISKKILRKAWEDKMAINLKEIENVYYG